MHFGIMGSPPPSFFLCSAAPPSTSLTWQWRRRRLKRAMRARVSLTKHEKQWTDGGQMRIRSQPRTFMARFRVGSERESEVSFWIELHFASAVPSILRSKDAAADPISIVGLESAKSLAV